MEYNFALDRMDVSRSQSRDIRFGNVFSRWYILYANLVSK